jgi:hypothetical protein
MKTPLFSSAIHLKLEPELHAAIVAVARQEHTTASELMRRTLRACVAERVSASRDDDNRGPFSPAPGQRIAA